MITGSMTIKTIRIVILALLGAVAQWACAQSPTIVTTEAELRSAIQTDGANITVTADIDLSNSTLSIESGTTVTIDLGGRTLDRKLRVRGEGGGQVITVRSGATLNLSNGTLKGGWGGNGGGLVNEGGTVNLTNVIITGNTADDRGGGISNYGTLTMTGGSIIGNTSNDQTNPSGGGGLFNYEGCTATLTNVTITDNEAKVKGGGGIFDIGKLSMEGCTVRNNTARTCGGGVWHGDDHVSGLELKMQGVNLITDNIAGGITGNLFLTGHRKITCTGSLEGSRIGVSLAVDYWFTYGFSSYHSGDDVSTIFQPDRPETNSVGVASNGEAIMRKKNLPEGYVPYIERRWDSENKKVLVTTKMLTTEIDFDAVPTAETQYKKLRSTDDDMLNLGTENSEVHEFFVVDEEEVNVKSLFVQGPNVHIILCDGAKLFFEKEIRAYEGHTIYIHAQSSGSSMGKLVNDKDNDVSGGLGGSDDNMEVEEGGNIEIHGGNLDLYGGNDCAAIGGNYKQSVGDISIFDGHIKVLGGDASAGIGAGKNTHNYGNINIYDGVIDATGGPIANIFMEAGGAGIGGGASNDNGNLTIWNGSITARGDGESAGIGGAQWGSEFCAGTIIINSGIVKAYGDDHGAGIGGGDDRGGGTVIINDGHVEAYGGTDAAGIGGGEGGNGGYVTITGGYVLAQGGSEYGAGIGGGQDGKGGNVTITGGIIVAKAGKNDTGLRAIGPGSGSNDYGTLELGDQMMVRFGDNGNWSAPVPVDSNPPYGRKAGAWYHTEARIEPCTHQGATYTDNGNSISVGCSYCTASTMPYTFYSNGNWNDDSKWFSNFMPHNGNDVAVKAQATIPADYCANVGDITIDGGTITIADGGQLIHKNNGVTATVQKNISQYTVDSGAGITDGWYFITSPVITSYTPDVTMLSNDFDIYRLNNTLWENWKQTGDHYHFDLDNSRGYLYANSEDVTLEFTGTVLPSANNKNVSVDAGFNLIGNPLLHNVYADRVYYKMNDERTGIIAVENYQENPITPCTGIIVNADASGTVTFTKAAPALANDNGSLQIALAQTGNERDATIQDNAIVSFNAGTTLPKFRYSENAEIYIPQDGDDYAIAYSDRTGEMPLHFKAQETGQYTVSFECDDLDGIKLIDKFENVTIDLGIENSYTFTASAADSRDRFVLVFSSTGIETGSEAEVFAYQSGSDIIVTGEGELQVFDMMGRMIYTRYLNGVGTHRVCPSQYGVYILKLNEKTQKIVIQ